ncbi:MAG: hypothetical protein QW764_02890 [Desulfurococcaceae archaeon]
MNEKLLRKMRVAIVIFLVGFVLFHYGGVESFKAEYRGENDTFGTIISIIGVIFQIAGFGLIYRIGVGILNTESEGVGNDLESEGR